MTTLISSNKENTNNANATAYNLKNGSKLLVADSKEIALIEEWLSENGVSAVFFDPAEDAEEYCDYIVANNSIELYN